MGIDELCDDLCGAGARAVALAVARLAADPPPPTWGLDDWLAAAPDVPARSISLVVTGVESATGHDYGPVLDQIAAREIGRPS